MDVLETVENHMNAALDSEKSRWKCMLLNISDQTQPWTQAVRMVLAFLESHTWTFFVSWLLALEVNAIVLFASRQLWPSCHAAFDVVSCGYPIVREEHLCTIQGFNHFCCQLYTVAQTLYDWGTLLTDCMTVSITGGPGPFKRKRPKILTIKEWGFLIRWAR